MKKINLLLRVMLFGLVLALGTLTALILGETTGLALADLSGTAVETLVETDGSPTLFATLEGQKQGIYRSDDYGRSWQVISQGPGGSLSRLAVHPVNKQILYATTRDEPVLWTSQNGGESWQSYPLNLAEAQPVSVLEIDPANPELLYVGTQGQGLHRVQPAYDRLEPVGDAAMQALYVEDVVINPDDNQVYAVTPEGLFVINGNASHKIENLPDVAVSLAVNPADPQVLYAGTAAYGLYRSPDGGRSWEALNQGLGWQPGLMLQVPAVAVDESDPQHLALTTAYLVGDQVIGEGLYETFNGGQHWTKIAAVDEVIDELLIKEGGIYAATPAGLIRYGDPMPAAPLSASLQARSLSHPTGVQIGVLILTVLAAGWILLGRLNWLPKRITA